MSNLSHLFYITHARVIPPPVGAGRVHKLSDATPKIEMEKNIVSAATIREEKVKRVLVVLTNNPLPTSLVASRSKLGNTTVKDILGMLVTRGQVQMTRIKASSGHYWSMAGDDECQ